MTNELEKQFFDTFGFEPKLKTFAIKRDEQGELTYPPIYEYPQISDRILLELICIFRQHEEMGYFTSVQELKKTLLADFIEYYDRKINARTYTWLIEDAKQIKQQVQALFEEG